MVDYSENRIEKYDRELQEYIGLLERIIFEDTEFEKGFMQDMSDLSREEVEEVVKKRRKPPRGNEGSEIHNYEEW